MERSMFLTADDWYDTTRTTRKHENLKIMRFSDDNHCESRIVTPAELKKVIADENSAVTNR